MFISHVDAALEQLVRTRLPLPEELADVSFDPPTKEWSAQLTRITVNFFLYDVQRSAQPSRSATRPAANGERTTATFRRPQPMILLSYLVSTWAGGPRDEHQLLGDLVSMVAGTENVPAELTPADLSSLIQVAMGDERNAGRELWQAIGVTLRPSIQLQATVAADTFDWEPLAPSVERITAMADRMPGRDRG